MNDQLSSNFLAWEVQVAVKKMAPLKVPGPDCMPLIFYQNYWQLVGDDTPLSQFCIIPLTSEPYINLSNP